MLSKQKPKGKAPPKFAKSKEDLKEEDYNEEIEAQKLLNGFIDSVGQRLMADVPVGIVLSGGLDSSLVAAVASDAAHRYNRPIPECWTVAESEGRCRAKESCSMMD